MDVRLLPVVVPKVGKGWPLVLVVSKKIETIKSRSRFLCLLKKGKRLHVSSWMVLNFQKNECGSPRFGWTLPRYIGGAVARNRIKRWLREVVRSVVRESSMPSSVDINIVLKKRDKDFYKSVKYDEFKRLLRPVLQELIGSI